MGPRSVLSPGFARLFVGFLCSTLNINLFALTPYFLELRGADERLFGAVAGTQGLAGVAAVALLGSRSDRWTRRRSALSYFAVGLLGNALALLSMDAPPAFYLVPLALQGVAMGVGLPILFVWASELCPPDRRTVAFAWFGIAGLIGDSVGPLLGEVLLNAQADPNTPAAFRAVFIAANILAPLSLGFFAWTPDVVPAASADRDDGLAPLLRAPGLPSALLAAVTFGGALGVMLSLGKNFVAHIGLQFVSVLLAGHTIGALASRLTLARLLARLRPTQLITCAFAGVVTSMLLLASTHSYVLLGLSGLTYGVSHGVLFPTLLSRVIDISGSAAAGRVTTLYMGVFGLGFGLMPTAGGLVLKLAGFPVLFRLVAFTCLCGLFLARRAERLHLRAEPVTG